MTAQKSHRPSDDLMDETLRILATDLILAMLASIPRENVNPMKHWDWALKALRVGAGRGRTYERMVSEMAAQLPIDGALRKHTASKVFSIGESLTAWKAYPTFRAMIRRDAIYIIVRAQHRNDEIKQLRAAAYAEENDQ